MLVGIAGRRMTGKSTVARAMEACGATRASFAGQLRVAAEAMGICAPEELRARKEEPFTCGRLFVAYDAWALGVGRAMDALGITTQAQARGFLVELMAGALVRAMPFETGRHLLQVLGTDVFRAHLGPWVWVWLLHRELAAADPKRVYVIDDVRFAEEAKYILACGGLMVHMSRIGFTLDGTTDAHQSESGTEELRDFCMITKCLHEVGEVWLVEYVLPDVALNLVWRSEQADPVCRAACEMRDEHRDEVVAGLRDAAERCGHEWVAGPLGCVAP